MSNEKLSPDATLADLTGKRTDREEFVRCVVGNYYASKIDRSQAVLRIGVEGSGKRPNYRLEIPTPIEVAGVHLSPVSSLIYNGANHDTMTAFEADRAQSDT